MGTAKEIATLFKYSPKCESIFWEVKGNVEIEAMPHKMDSKRFLLRIHSRNYSSPFKARILSCEHQMKEFDFFYSLITTTCPNLCTLQAY